MIWFFLFSCKSAEQTYSTQVYAPGTESTSPNQPEEIVEPSQEEVFDDSFGGVLRRLDLHGEIDPEDLVIAEEFMSSRSNNRVYCDDIWRIQFGSQQEILRGPEMVWPHASVPDLLILDSGEHLLVYNDLRKDIFMDVLRNEPSRFWRQGLLGYGGIGFSIDRFDGNGFVEMLDVDLQFSTLQRAVDPDLGRMLDGNVRLSWFGMTTDVLEDGTVSPMETTKPHQFYRSQRIQSWIFTEPFLAVSSYAGRTGGVDPSILTLQNGGEILYVGPLDEYVMGWYSEDLLTWPDEPDVETRVAGVTVDTLYTTFGQHEMFYMRNGVLGQFEVQASSNGFDWASGPQTLYFETDAHNLTVDYDPDGNLWLYYNLWNADCLAAVESN